MRTGLKAKNIYKFGANIYENALIFSQIHKIKYIYSQSFAMYERLSNKNAYKCLE